MWEPIFGYAASPDSAIGSPGRLERELDALNAIGFTNLRLLASSELSPLKNPLNPAVQSSDGSLNKGLLKGLDKALALMAQRNMTAILYLTNFWAWGSEGHALHDDYRMKPEETAYVVDPPHEPQGWYLVFDTDAATKTLFSDAAQKLAEAKGPWSFALRDPLYWSSISVRECLPYAAN